MDIVAAWMMRENIPLTRENYLTLAYFGAPPDEIGPEEESMMPRWAQIDPAEEFDF